MSHHVDARSSAKANALDPKPSLKLLGIFLYTLLDLYDLSYLGL